MKTSASFALEPQTLAFIEELSATSAPPIYTLTPQQARQVLEKVQSQPAEKPAVDVEELVISTETINKVPLKIIRPHTLKSQLPVIFFVHGAGWVMGSPKTYERLVCELAVGANAAVAFVDYSLSPEAQFPVALEELYGCLTYIHQNCQKFNFNPSKIALCGDSVGGNMATALALIAQERKGPKIICQVLFYPVTSADLNTRSYQDFAEGPWLTKAAMEWFWDAYLPNKEDRKNPLASPLNASRDQLKNMPKALVITAENDVLRDEGEAYAHRLMESGVEVTAVRFLGTMHDFVMLNALAHTTPTRSAIAMANAYLTLAFK